MAYDVLYPLQPPDLAVEGTSPLELLSGFFGDKIKDVLELLPVEEVGGHGLQLLVHLRHLDFGDLGLLEDTPYQFSVHHFLYVAEPGVPLLLLLLLLSLPG